MCRRGHRQDKESGRSSHLIPFNGLMMPVNIAVVGCGKIAERHVGGIVAQHDSALVALVDPSAAARQSLLEKWWQMADKPAGTSLHQADSLYTLLESDVVQVDVVLLCVPHDLHEVCLALTSLALSCSSRSCASLS